LKGPIVTIKPLDVDQFLVVGCGRCERGNTPQCKVHAWHEELTVLRSYLKQSPLKEEIKWHCPCYTSDGNNILMLSALNESVVVSFFKGALLDDPDGLLVKPGENSHHARYLRFTSVEQAKQQHARLNAFIQQAIELAQRGETVKPKTVTSKDYPAELHDVFNHDADYLEAFERLTPGRQRSYLLHINSAKQAKTKLSRIAKCREKVLIGKGWNER
jgi:uncharacterized protein YdeI (YjbR/CyaY-like superfamily)